MNHVGFIDFGYLKAAAASCLGVDRRRLTPKAQQCVACMSRSGISVGYDMHRYNREGVKRAAETSHQGSADEALQNAIEAVRSGYREMIESWRR